MVRRVPSSSVPVEPASTAPSAPWQRHELAAVCAVGVLAIALRLHAVERWSWSVAEAAMWRAIQLPWTGPDGFFASEFVWQPLVPLGLRVWLELGLLPSHGEGWLRLPFVLVGALTVPLLAIVGRRFVGTWVALLAALLVALHPAHVTHSQSMTAPVVVTAAALLALLAAGRGSRRGIGGAAVMAGLCHPLGFVLLALLVPAPAWRRGQWTAVVLPAVAAAVALPVLRAPLLVVGFAAVAAERRLDAVVVAAGTLLLGAFACGVGGEDGGALAVVALPSIALLAAAGAARLAAAVREALVEHPGLGRAASSLLASLMVVDLAISSFLLLTLFHGGRADWRAAARATLQAANRAPALAVVAGSGSEPLRCYLRPDHWREPAGDPHPGRGVVPIARDDARDVLTAVLAAPAAFAIVVVLTEAEWQALPPACQQLVAQRCERTRVVPSPQTTAATTLSVFVRRPQG